MNSTRRQRREKNITSGVLTPSQVFRACSAPPPPDGRDPRLPATTSRSLRALRPDSQCPPSPARQPRYLVQDSSNTPPLPCITRAVFAGALPARAVPPGLPASEKLDKDHFHRASCTIPAGQRQLPLAPRPPPLCPPAPGTASGLARRLSTSRMLVSSPDPCAPLQALHWECPLPAQVPPPAGASLPLASQDLPCPFLRAPLARSLSLPPPSLPPFLAVPLLHSLSAPPTCFPSQKPSDGKWGWGRCEIPHSAAAAATPVTSAAIAVPCAARPAGSPGRRQPPLGATPLGGSLGGTGFPPRSQAVLPNPSRFPHPASARGGFSKRVFPHCLLCGNPERGRSCACPSPCPCP